MIRLFTALLIPDEIKQQLLSTCYSLVENPEQYRWAGPDNIHLTLKFIGEVDEDLTEPIKDELAFTEEFEHFDCTISRFGFFFRDGEPKILWARLNTDKRIHTLVEELNHRLSIFSIPVEKRRFKPHLTMLRLKQHPGEEFINKFKVHSFEKINFELITFALVKSELFQSGARYTEIKKYNLM
ncbi:MAG: RNA 2',3'-cyclic phosphodiesterase [Ignavibacterium sp.]|nr:MAG: RNA 2',3'-cyclic phosphodiesterase [Ignavibacterium sp.]